jgi:hypothetical protein
VTRRASPLRRRRSCRCCDKAPGASVQTGGAVAYVTDTAVGVSLVVVAAAASSVGLGLCVVCAVRDEIGLLAGRETRVT